MPVVVRLYKVKYEICKQVLNLPCGRAAIGRISLEYPSIDEARASQNMFNGEWTFRLLESAGWEVALHEAMTIFHQTLCKSPYNYEGPSNKPDQRRVAVPQLEVMIIGSISCFVNGFGKGHKHSRAKDGWSDCACKSLA